MKKVLLFIATLLTVAFVYSQAPDTWTQKTDFGGGARMDAVGFSIGSKGYIGGSTKDFWEYDPVVNVWTQKADFGGIARIWAVGFSINNKGYIGTGHDGSTDMKDFWEYDPDTNTWTQKADFEGNARHSAVGFSIGDKGYIGTGTSFNPIYYKDFWEYDPAANTWAQKADFGGGKRWGAVGFNIGSKGYIGTGSLQNGNIGFTNFWEYDPATNTWTQKADFGGTARYSAVGFSIGSKGYLGTGNLGGIFKKDFWEYNPVANSWTQKTDFGGTGRFSAVGFGIGSKGYVGTGSSGNWPYEYYNDFWEYAPTGCPVPANLRVSKTSDTSAGLNWKIPDSSVEYIRVVYRPVGSSTWKAERKKPEHSGIYLSGLTLNTPYEWKVKNICAEGKTRWVNGPNFTTTTSPAFTSIADAASDGKVQGKMSVQIMPNPNEGSFTLQMQLPAKAASTTLALYDNLGAAVWKQDAGRLGGSVNRNIALESKLAAGVYVLMVQHGSTRLMQKVVVVK